MVEEVLAQIFTVKNVVIYFICVNIFTFLIMWYDKHEAKIGQWRVSEGFLFFLVLLRWRYTVELLECIHLDIKLKSGILNMVFLQFWLQKYLYLFI